MLSPNIKWLLNNLSSGTPDVFFESDPGPVISVNQLTGRAGAFYEKIRYLIEYKDEHTIRRSAIERILKRKMLIEQAETVGLSLLQELVRAGYLSNKRVPEHQALPIQAIVEKYRLVAAGRTDPTLISVMATAIERLLYPTPLNERMAEVFYTTLRDRVKYAGPVTGDELTTQIYLGCRRILLEDDQETLLYVRLLQYLPELSGVTDEQTLRSLTPRFEQALTAIRTELAHPLSWKIASKIKSYAIYFEVIRELIRIHGPQSEALFLDNARLEQDIKNLLAKKYAELRVRVRSSGNRAVVYVFLTKIILGVALELPFEKFFLASSDYSALGVNLVFHPMLLLFMVKTVPLPSAQNTASIINGVKSILTHGDIKTLHIRDLSANQSLYLLFVLFYAILFAISFGLILWGLIILRFNPVSIVLFLLFLTLVSYFGFRVRSNSQKWLVPIEDEGAMSLLADFFALPIINTGRWLSRRFSSVNVFVFILDFILETPFKFLLGTFDAFLSYLKESKDDLY